jgi:predicted protein tyrosine phosphatase
MIKSIHIFPRYEMRSLIESNRKLKTDLPWHLISIYGEPIDKCIANEADHKTLQEKGCVDVLELDFSDVTDEQYHAIIQRYPEMRSKIKLFSTNQAKEIVFFLRNINEKNDSTLIAQCNAGISRSGAVGIFACKFLGLDEKIFRMNNPFINPNAYVYDLLCKISGMRDDHIKFWEETVHIDAKHIF